jgi:hypothetical protein
MRLWLPLLLTPVLALAAADDKEPAKDTKAKSPEPGTLLVVDAAGKDQKLKTWKFVGGTRRLSWLAAARPEPKAPPKKRSADQAAPEAAEPPAGPEALELRPETEIHFAEGVLLLIPLDRLHSLDYDNDMETVTAKVAVATGMEETFTGSTKYKKINKLVLAAEVDKGDLGIADVRYLGGVPRGIRGIRFPAPAAVAAAPAGRAAVVVSADGKNKTTHKVSDLLAMYQVSENRQRLLPTLAFRKTLKIDLAKVKKITAGGEGEGAEPTWQVQLKDGNDESLVLLPSLEVEGRKATLEGLVGRVPAGYKLFPVDAIAEISFDAQ